MVESTERVEMVSHGANSLTCCQGGAGGTVENGHLSAELICDYDPIPAGLEFYRVIGRRELVRPLQFSLWSFDDRRGEG